MTEQITFDAQQLAKEVKVTVKIDRLSQFRFRLWIVEKLLQLAIILSWTDFDIDLRHPLERTIEALGDAGITISTVYGSGRWSVQCLYDKTEETFEHPYAANTLDHCVEIAIIEAKRRGWIDK